MRPHIYRTHDGGKTWQEIVNGLPDNAPVNVVREDPVRRGLLFAGTERAVFVSFNDGDDWQPLRLNMPATSIRDLVIHDDDVVVGTHGRSFWILDDITPLRQLNAEVAARDVHLFAPQAAYRVHWNLNPDTPLPPEEPAGTNPPDGAVINYYLKADSQEPVTLEILDARGKLARRYASTDKPEKVVEEELDVPTYWIRPTQILPASAGPHRFVWDLHYPPPEGGRHTYPISAIYQNTPSEPRGPWVLPGKYVVRLTAGGKVCEQPLEVKMDPRVKTSPAVLQQQFELSMQCYEGMQHARAAMAELGKLRAQLRQLRDKVKDEALQQAVAEVEKKVAAFQGAERRFFERPEPGVPQEPTLARLVGDMSGLLHVLQGADAAPTSQAVAGCAEAQRALHKMLQRRDELTGKDLKALNDRLREAGLPPL
jgi:hypothetical protein